jgi:hypothetical protein
MESSSRWCGRMPNEAAQLLPRASFHNLRGASLPAVGGAAATKGAPGAGGVRSVGEDPLDAGDRGETRRW